MKKLSLLLVLAIASVSLMFTGCKKENSEPESLQTMDVVFKAKADLAVSNKKSGPVDVNPVAYGDDMITLAVSKLYLKAEHLLSGTVTTGEYVTVKDGSGENQIRLQNVPVGKNLFSAYTESYMETPETDPRPADADGFSAWNKYPKNISGDPTVEVPVDTLIKRLRYDLPPYVTFKSNEVAKEILYAGCEDGDPDCYNSVELNMEPEQGRKMVTVMFQDTDQAKHYMLWVKMTHNSGAGPAPSVTVDLDHVQGVNLPYAWFYLTHPTLTDATELNLEIKLYEKGSSTVLHTWNISSTDPMYKDRLSAKIGVDSWTNIILDAEALTADCVGVMFKWNWTNEDNEIILGDCNGDGIVDDNDDCPIQ